MAPHDAWLPVFCARPAAGREGSVRPDWAHIYLSVLSALPLHSPHDETRVASALRAAAAAITARHSTQLRKAAVAQWEVRLRVPDKTGAWRVVVAAPTGHEAGEECVEVYRESSAGSPGGSPGGSPPPGAGSPGSASGAAARMVYVSKHFGGEF